MHHTRRAIRTTLPMIAVVVAACSKPPAADNATPLVAVSVANVTSDTIAQTIVATGSYGSRDEIPLAFKIGGVIARVTVDAGHSVRKGQLLATLDMREIDALVAKAKVAVDKTERDQARIARLAADSVATLSQLQDATSALDAARADYRTASVNREYASIVAPEDGVVLLKSATAGSNIAAGTTVVVLGGGARGRVLHVGLSDRDVMRVHLGDVATVRFTATGDQKFAGRVSLIGQSSDPRTGTYAVEITITDAGTLPTGLVGRAEIAVRGKTSAAMIPVDALLEADSDSATVYTISKDTDPVAMPHRVRIASLSGDRAAVIGLPQDSRVITRGAPYVLPGARVRVVDGEVALARTGAQQ